MSVSQEIVHARITVAGTRNRKSTAAFGRDIIIDPRVLSDYCFQPLGARVDDLLHVAAAVAFADRLVSRRPAYVWRRILELQVAVREPEFWQQPAIRRSLTDCLDRVSGDVWNVSFTGGREPLAVNPQAPLAL